MWYAAVFAFFAFLGNAPSLISVVLLIISEISSVQLWLSLWVAGVLSPSSISEGRLIIEMGGWGERAGE